MKGNRALALAVLVSTLSGCAFDQSKPAANDSGSPEKFLGYQPIDPLPAKSVTYYDPKERREVTVPWGSLENSGGTSTDKDAVTITRLLPLQSARVSVQKRDTSGKVSYLTSSISQSAGTYEVVMDFMKYRVAQVYSGAGHYSGDAIVGVGLRIRAAVVTTKSGLNFSSLVGLGMEASRGNLSGSIAVDVYGIDSPDVTNLIPLSTEIDQTSIQNALQGLAAIKAKLWQQDTRLYPHVLGLRQASANQIYNIERQVAVYANTTASEQLRHYWKPDGLVVDKAHEQRLETWMKQNGISGPITMFLYDSSQESLRQKAVRELIEQPAANS